MFNTQDGNLHVVYTGAIIPGMYPALETVLAPASTWACNASDLNLLRLNFEASNCTV